MCLENIQDLDTLFKEWRKKHESEERGTRYTDTFPYKKDYTCSDDFNKSFCCDGFIEYMTKSTAPSAYARFTASGASAPDIIITGISSIQ